MKLFLWRLFSCFGVLFLWACGGDSDCPNGIIEGSEACDDGNTANGDSCDSNCTVPACGNGITANDEECDDANASNEDACAEGCRNARCGDGFTKSGAEECDDGNNVNEDACSNDCRLPRCGDGIVQTGEECDDDNENNGDACTNQCKDAACGDGFIQSGLEECDDSNAIKNDECNACKLARCGDGVAKDIDNNGVVDLGDEACDDGNQNNADDCTTNCDIARCGDGFEQPNREEDCDDGDSDNSDTCTDQCKDARCGDGITQASNGEACDDGNQDDTDGCTNACRSATCGDGFVQAQFEVCDDGNANNFDACTTICVPATCGDGFVQPGNGELCDDNNQINDDACSNTCKPAQCGDGIVQLVNNEQCDDFNTNNHDSCLNTCRNASCGDSVTQTGVEACDDGNTSNFDACTTICHTATCGDGFRQGNEDCDDGNVDNDDTCTNTCTNPVCGDGIAQVSNGEECDDGNQDNSDECIDNCQVAFCGDGFQRVDITNPNDPNFEACDDGDGSNFDGCTTTCKVARCGDSLPQLEVGEKCDNGDGSNSNTSSCTLSCQNALCGDGFVQVGIEQCDDANNIDTDACTTACQNARCGDGFIQSGEQCDDGNSNNVDACSNFCGIARCGDSIIQVGETCDDGDQNDTDDCPTSCLDSFCGDGFVQAGLEECDDENFLAGDGCENDCALTCGDGVVNFLAGEQCDDGNSVDSDGCNNDCSETHIVQLAVGSQHTCALLNTGDVRCWGFSNGGQLGYGNTNPIGDNETPASAGNVDVGGSVVQIAAGGGHTCALLDTGNVRCWGFGSGGQLGYGNTTPIGDNETPASAGNVNVGGIVTQISAGNNHTCALLDTGNVRCWGFGREGQLGYGNTTPIGDNETPSSAGNVNVGGSVIQISAGFDYTCALLDTGNVRCWGSGSGGQLGYGNTTPIGDNETPSSAGNVNVGGIVTQITAGHNHTCALLDTGDVRCWGSGSNGKLGYGNTNNIGDNETPASDGNINVNGTVIQISAGSEHTCALLDTGDVRCWGRGESGQLGYGNTNTIGDNETPASAGNVNVGGTVTQIAAGGGYTCVLLNTGNARCWGLGELGELGYVNTDHIGIPASAGNVDVGGTVIQIVAGSLHTCALLDTGNVRCWGAGSNGQLGYGNTNTTGTSQTPASVGNINVGGTAIQISTSFGYTCALLNTGNVRCWGAGSNGQLGYGNTNNIGDNETPDSAGNINVLLQVSEIEAGLNHSCGIFFPENAIRCLGNGGSGKLGYGTINNIGDDETPLSAGMVNVGGASSQLALGGSHTCAIVAGTVRCWGEAGSGQLGYGNTNNIGDNAGEMPPVSVNLGAGVTTSQIVAGFDYTCILTTTNAVKCWGRGSSGQLGNNGTANIGDNVGELPATASVLSATEISANIKVIRLAAGGDHTCALLDTGDVRCWGLGSSGQLGYRNTNNIGDNELPSSAGNILLDGFAVDITAGGSHTCALLNTGDVRCWGLGSSGQLGYNNTNSIGDNEAPAFAGNVNVGGFVVEVSAGQNHTCAMLDTGDVRCWGDAAFGQLGYGSTLDVGDNETPASAGSISLGDSAIHLDAGGSHTCVALDNGLLRCWGFNFFGQLGNASTANIGDDEVPTFELIVHVF